MAKTPDFSDVAKEYASHRPGYPAELFEWLANSVKKKDKAWDVATGSGQAALGLAGHFEHVIATDVSLAQLRHAAQHPRIEYQVARAEASGLSGQSVDLVAVAAAIHCFAEGARMVDARYTGLSLPGEELPTPSFRVSVRWTSRQVMDFVKTWSGVQSYIAATKQDPLPELATSIEAAFGGAEAVREVGWPLYLRAARL